jgi:hypothetical protein
MANLQYFVVRTDEDELQVFYGRKRPAQIPEDADEVGLRFVPLNWEILHACDDEESAEKKLEEELAKLPDQKKDQTKSEE